MIYKFKKWVILPAYTEIIVSANSDEEALKILKAIKYNISNLKQKHYIKKYPDRYRPGRYRLKF